MMTHCQVRLTLHGPVCIYQHAVFVHRSGIRIVHPIPGRKRPGRVTAVDPTAFDDCTSLDSGICSSSTGCTEEEESAAAPVADDWERRQVRGCSGCSGRMLLHDLLGSRDDLCGCLGGRESPRDGGMCIIMSAMICWDMFYSFLIRFYG